MNSNPDLKGMSYLKKKLIQKEKRVRLRYAYYDMKHEAEDLMISTPTNLRWLVETLGWCTKSVDSLADRIVFREFRNDIYDINEIFKKNNPDVFADSAVLSALISSCCFIYISPDKNEYPRMQVIDGANATGEIDYIAGLLTEGYAVLKRDSNTNKPIAEAYFTTNKTYYYECSKLVNVLDHKAGNCLLVPVIYRPDAARPFGHSRISRACMSLQDVAIRTLKRSEITAEFYSFPQKYATGVSPDAEKMDTWRATISKMLTFEKDDEGGHPQIGQFSQQSVQPHIDQLKMAAAAFCGETGLTLDDLGFPQSNPSSVEAIKAAHESLRLTARKAQRTFGSGLLNAGYVAACLRDKYTYERALVAETYPVFEPIFEPDVSALSGIGDAILKLNQAIPEYITAEKMRDITGI